MEIDYRTKKIFLNEKDQIYVILQVSVQFFVDIILSVEPEIPSTFLIHTGISVYIFADVE